MLIRSIAVGVAAVAMMSSVAQAADLIIPTTPAPIMESAGFSWDGLYIGARGGYNGYNGSTYGVIGGVVGANFIVADPILLGAEVTADYIWNNTTSAGEYFFNLKAGAVVTDSVLIYALGGVGNYATAGTNAGVYQLGGGVELAVTDAITVRGELVGQGDFDGANDAFFEGAKATVGVFYHF